VSRPVFLIIQAVAAIIVVKGITGTRAKEAKSALIIEILSIVFAFIRFLNDITPATEGFDAVLGMISATGDAALGIQGILAQPLYTPMQIMGLLTAGGTRDEADFAVMAASRRVIDDEDLTKIETIFGALDKDFRGIIKYNCNI
jgi:glucan 1,3-beta-glucosidase